MQPTIVNMEIYLKIVVLALLCLAYIAIFVGGWAVAYAWLQAKKEVKSVPKIPMLICDIHGAYPAKSSVFLEVPGTETGKIEFCPFCAKDRVSKKKVPV